MDADAGDVLAPSSCTPSMTTEVLTAPKAKEPSSASLAAAVPDRLRIVAIMLSLKFLSE